MNKICEKLIKQIELIEGCPSEALNIAHLIDFKFKTDKVFTKSKCEVILDNISELESVLKFNQIANTICQRELDKIKSKMYKKIDFFKIQEQM